VGEIVERLRSEGILDQTVIFFITDHGVSHGRGKQHRPHETMGHGRQVILKTYLSPNDFLDHLRASWAFSPGRLLGPIQ